MEIDQKRIIKTLVGLKGDIEVAGKRQSSALVSLGTLEKLGILDSIEVKDISTALLDNDWSQAKGIVTNAIERAQVGTA